MTMQRKTKVLRKNFRKSLNGCIGYSTSNQLGFVYEIHCQPMAKYKKMNQTRVVSGCTLRMLVDSSFNSLTIKS